MNNYEPLTVAKVLETLLNVPPESQCFISYDSGFGVKPLEEVTYTPQKGVYFEMD